RLVSRDWPFGQVTSIDRRRPTSQRPGMERPGSPWAWLGPGRDESWLRRLRRLAGLQSPGLLAAAGVIVVVELTARVDRQANRQLGADWLDVVPALLGTQHDVAGFCMNRAVLAFDPPVDLTAKHDPPFVVMVVVRIVRLPGRM